MLTSISTLGRMAIAAALFGIVTPVEAQESDGVVSRFSSIWTHDCTETGNGGNTEDWISYRCEGEGGLAVFLLFTDSVRLSLGFGDRTSMLGPYSAQREQNWPVEWRGRMVEGGFVPRAAIVRMRVPPELDDSGRGGSGLVVFRVGDESCVIGEVRGAGANERARRMADEGQCTSNGPGAGLRAG